MTLVDGVEETEETVKVLKQQVRSVIGPFATPEYIIVTAVRSVSLMGALLQCLHATLLIRSDCPQQQALPKTRSGKIMRRILRKLASGQTELGDVSTLADSSVVDTLKAKVADVLKNQGCKKK